MSRGLDKDRSDDLIECTCHLGGTKWLPKASLHFRPSAFAVLLGVAVAMLVLAYVDGAWTRYLSQWDPPVARPHYYALRTAKWATAPLAGGLACGLAVWLMSRIRVT